MHIGKRAIGLGHPCYVIAEAGVNHDGDVTVAKQLVEAAIASGADAVKFQTFRASEIASAASPKATYQMRTTDSHESQLAMLRRLELTAGQFGEIAEHARNLGIEFLSSPFDVQSLDDLIAIGVRAIKVASGEITNPDLLAAIARKGLPIILSTGMATLDDVSRALNILRANGDPEVVLLHCVSSYPADPRDANLRAMQTLADEFGRLVGFSDHTTGTEVALAAVACGAAIIEKHLTLDRNRRGPDHAASLEPTAFAQMAAAIRTVEASLGHGRKEPAPCEAEIAAVARRSLVANGDIAPGTTITPGMLAVRRPGTGISPFERDKVEGRRARRAISDGMPITADLIE